MKKQIYDEKNGLSYTLHGDYYLPDLEINEEEPTYGKYGIMRKQFLKEHRREKSQTRSGGVQIHRPFQRGGTQPFPLHVREVGRLRQVGFPEGALLRATVQGTESG